MIQIENRGEKKVLTVDGKPFILIAGEVHNSDSSSPLYMEKIWDIAEGLGMNALLLPVTWEMTEPKEGQFDFSVPKALMDQARERGKKIVFLWFGSWKNGECMYAPEWVKMDLERFPRAQIEKGKNKAGRVISDKIPVRFPYTTLSYLYEETAKTDAKAFAAFMGFLKEYDETEQTVVAVQVENEPGLLGAAREVSDEADEIFCSPVPAEFLDYMKTHTDILDENTSANLQKQSAGVTWEEAFGTAADEIFSAYHVAKYIEIVASAGKDVYPLPMAVNCWLDKGDAPGTYPTGGPVAKVHDIWRYCAPSIDIYCPDIYVPYFKEICDTYTKNGNPLFIPECATHSYAAPRMVYTVGHYHAMCYSPFGFDDIGKPFSAVQSVLFGADVSDPALKTPQNFEEYGKLGHMLCAMLPMLAEAYGTNRLQAVSAETDPAIPHPSGVPYLTQNPVMDFGAFRLGVTFQNMLNPRADGVCLCLAVSDTECWIIGNACSLSFESGISEEPNLDLLLLEEGSFIDGEWMPGRRLNGDEAAQKRIEAPSIWHAKFFTYKNS